MGPKDQLKVRVMESAETVFGYHRLICLGSQLTVEVAVPRIGSADGSVDRATLAPALCLLEPRVRQIPIGVCAIHIPHENNRNSGSASRFE